MSATAVARVAGLAGLGLYVLLMALSDVIARTPAGRQHLAPDDQSPASAFIFGTDALGRDVFSETIHAIAVSVPQAVAAAAVAILLGAIAGFGAVRLPMRLGPPVRGIAGVIGAAPALFLAIVLAVLLGPGWTVFAVGLAAAPAAFMRSFDRAEAFADSRHAEFAHITGIPATTLLRRDLVYEIRARFISIASRALAVTTILLATLSFVGFGASAPVRDLGRMIADARPVGLTDWWTLVFPVLALMLLILFARMAAILDEGEAP
jgi:peptide/nickel transport system permease protein